MTDTNVVVVKGNLTRDLGNDERNFGYAANGQARANITIACNRSHKKGDEWVNDVNYFDVTIWGKTAENLKPYLTKGKAILVQGYLQQNRWEKDGQKMSKINIIAENVQLLGNNNSGKGNQESNGDSGNFADDNSYASNGNIPF